MASDDHLRRLQNLQRDLAAFTESRLPNLERLAVQLESSVGDFRKLLAKTKRNEASRAALLPKTGGQADTVKIDEVEYQLNEQFRQAALLVADDLDIDEIEAAKLCMASQSAIASADDPNLPLRAVVNFHEGRAILLDCLRLLLQLSLDTEDERLDVRSYVRECIQGEGPSQQSSAYWRKCMDGLSEVEEYLKKIENHRQMMVMTGQQLSEDQAHALQSQHQLVMRQHECLVTILSSLIHGSYVQPEDYRALISKAAALEAHMDITIHYLPILASGAHHFGSDLNVTMDAAKDLNNLFAAGPAQLQWKQSAFRAAATVIWLAEYSSRFIAGENSLDEAEQARASEDALELFFDSLRLKAFHFLLAAATFLKPVVWFEPSRVGLVEYLLNESPPVPSDALRASDDFSTFTMRELQNFTDAFVTNMPDAVRKLKTEEDEKRRDYLNEASDTYGELDLERFMVIMACAYQDDSDATRDFWSDRESNLYGFLRWSSQRLPTPRVAAFCQLLRSIACDEKSANQAHLFLVEDTVMMGGKLRKAYSISWTQIFSELEIFSKTLTDPSNKWENRQLDELEPPGVNFTEPETGIMLDSYLGLATHICRTSPDARNWILKEQQFHIGEGIFQLASTEVPMRVRACCMDFLSALLVDKIPEVRNGVWVLLDEWLFGEHKGRVGYSGPNMRPPRKRHLEDFANNAEASASLVNLFNALIDIPRISPEGALDTLPFPEQLGTTNRNSGVDKYVDYVLQVILAHRIPQMADSGEANMVNIVRSDCLGFILICLDSFNEHLVLLANTTNVGIEEAMETKSLANYVRLHPFARIMEWIINTDVTNAIFTAIQSDTEAVDNAPYGSPLVQSTLKAIQVLNLAWKLQATYFDIVRPLSTSQTSRARPIPSSVIGSIDELFLPRLSSVHSIAKLTTCRHLEVSLESLSLFERISSSRKLNGGPVSHHARGQPGNRVLTAVMSIGPTLTLRFGEVFLFDDWDFEQEEITPKYTKAKTILQLLNASLDASDGKPTIAHCLLGLDCDGGKVKMSNPSAFASGASLFHEIARCAVDIPVASRGSHISWLLSLRRGCIETMVKLSTSDMTASLIRRELRQMLFVESLAQKQFPVTYFPLWDFKASLDPNLLLDGSALAVRDFMRVREFVFELYAIDLRTAAEAGSYSVQERLIGLMRGAITTPTDTKIPVASIFELFDFFELQITTSSDVERRLLTNLDFSGCAKPDPDVGQIYDTRMAEELLNLRKRELVVKGEIKEPAQDQLAVDETVATVAALTTQNNWRGIQDARLAALEAWTDLLALMVAKGGMNQTECIALALQGLLVALPRYEKSLPDENQAAAALLAKLVLTLTNAITPALQDQSQQTANVAMERLQSVFRVSLKAVTDSSTDLALRDVCYRTCCAILAAVSAITPTGPAPAQSTHKQLLQMVQNAGDRLITVVTEDTFSGRGITRISALLFLDGLVALFQGLKAGNAMLRSLTKLNFVPVLIDTSVGSIASIFGGEDELAVSLSYFHTALALLLRLCQSADGTQLVLNSNLFAAIDDSNLFSTDPDIGFDIDNPEALREFYRILTEVLRVVTAAVLTKGPQAAKGFLQAYRPSVQAIFKRTSREAGPEELIGVADEMGKLILATGFLEDDAIAYERRTNGFT